MAFPYLLEADFEDGTLGAFDSETDTANKLDFPHYSTLASIPGMTSPFRGAYCLRVQLDGSTADAYLTEGSAFDTAAAGTIAVRFALWFGGNPVMANNDTFTIFNLRDAGTAAQAYISIGYTTAGGFALGVTGAGTATTFTTLTLNDWHVVEMVALIDSGVPNDGTIQGYLDGVRFANITGINQNAIADALLGIQSQDAGTTAGVVLIDSIIADDARIYGSTHQERWKETVSLTSNGHVFVGPGVLENISLSSGSTDNVLECYDTDTGTTNDLTNRLVRLQTSTAGEIVDPAGMPLYFNRGCYVKMTGTASASGPFGIAKIGRAVAYGSDGAVRGYGAKRKQLIGNV